MIEVFLWLVTIHLHIYLLFQAKENYHARYFEFEKLKREGGSQKDIERAEVKFKKARKWHAYLYNNHALGVPTLSPPFPYVCQFVGNNVSEILCAICMIQNVFESSQLSNVYMYILLVDMYRKLPPKHVQEQENLCVLCVLNHRLNLYYLKSIWKLTTSDWAKSWSPCPDLSDSCSKLLSTFSKCPETMP